MREELFRAVLSNLLEQIIANDSLMRHYNPEDIYLETKRLDFSISIEEYEKKQLELNPEGEINFPKLFTGSFLPLNLSAKIQGKIGKETNTRSPTVF